MFGSAFSSPVIEEINGNRQVIVQTRTNLTGVNPKSGKEIWSKPIKAFRGMNILTPTITDNTIFTSSYGRKIFTFQTHEKWKKTATGTNMGEPSGRLYVWPHHPRRLLLYSPTQAEDHLSGHENGETKWISSESFGKYMSMVSNGKEILALDEDGTLYLIDPNPEKFVIKESRKISESPTWAHLAIADNQISLSGSWNLHWFVTVGIKSVS